MLTVLLYTFAGIVAIQLIYYLFLFGKFSFSKANIPQGSFPPISVVICAKNESANLTTFLPKILQQDYPTFEVILINDASSDDTREVMEQFASQDPRIKVVNVENNEAFWGNKKYALTLGIKQTSYEHLLFTDADCVPNSERWIQSMSNCFSKEKTIVLGYGAYQKIKGSFLNKLIRFETLLTAVQYFGYAKAGTPYMAVGRNLAYRKDEFFNVNGFVDHIRIKSGDDDLFVNQVSNGKNTACCITKESFTTSVPKKTFGTWYRQKRRHVSTASFYKLHHKILLALFYLSQLLFWALAITLSAITFQWPWVVGLIGLRFLTQYIVLGKAAKRLEEKDLTVGIPIFELFLILFQFTIFIANRFSRPNHWK